MGDFLLSLLGFDHEGVVIFTRVLKGSRYKVGDAVPFVYPNQERKTKRKYYRILEKFYEPDQIVELLHTRDPNVIDLNGFVNFQRVLLGKEMLRLASTGHSFQQIATQYKWHRHAVDYAIKQYQKWQVLDDARVMAEEQEGMTYIPADTPEMKAKIQKVLENWS